MKTTFILHGGMLSHDNPSNDTFFQEFSKDFTDDTKVLFIGLARRNEEDRQRIYERDKGYILAQTDKSITVENAELETITEQAAAADAIFITGGDTMAMVDDLRENAKFIEAIKGKVIAGSSAGAYLFSQYYWACAGNEVEQGLGLIPYRVKAHYGNPEFNSTEETLSLIQAVHQEYELLLLPECEWVVKEIEL
jgi:peptidase E